MVWYHFPETFTIGAGNKPRCAELELKLALRFRYLTRKTRGGSRWLPFKAKLCELLISFGPEFALTPCASLHKTPVRQLTLFVIWVLSVSPATRNVAVTVLFLELNHALILEIPIVITPDAVFRPLEG